MLRSNSNLSKNAGIVLPISERFFITVVALIIDVPGCAYTWRQIWQSDVDEGIQVGEMVAVEYRRPLVVPEIPTANIIFLILDRKKIGEVPLVSIRLRTFLAMYMAKMYRSRASACTCFEDISNAGIRHGEVGSFGLRTTI